MPLAPVAIIGPLEEELAPLRAHLVEPREEGSGPWELLRGRAGGRPVVAVVSDCGPANAAAACERLVALEHPVAVLLCGSAGAHDPELLPGDVVLGSGYRILHPAKVQAQRAALGLHPKGFRFRRDGRREHFEECPADPALLAAASRLAPAALAAAGPWEGPGWPASFPRRTGKAVAGLVGSWDSWTREPAELARLGADLGTACEDMESAFVAQLCTLHRLPFLAVRGISNNEAVAPVPPSEVPRAIAAAAARAAAIVARVAATVR